MRGCVVSIRLSKSLAPMSLRSA